MTMIENILYRIDCLLSMILEQDGNPGAAKTCLNIIEEEVKKEREKPREEFWFLVVQLKEIELKEWKTVNDVCSGPWADYIHIVQEAGATADLEYLLLNVLRITKEQYESLKPFYE